MSWSDTTVLVRHWLLICFFHCSFCVVVDGGYKSVFRPTGRHLLFRLYAKHLQHIPQSDQMSHIVHHSKQRKALFWSPHSFSWIVPSLSFCLCLEWPHTQRNIHHKFENITSLEHLSYHAQVCLYIHIHFYIWWCRIITHTLKCCVSLQTSGWEQTLTPFQQAQEHSFILLSAAISCKPAEPDFERRIITVLILKSPLVCTINSFFFFFSYQTSHLWSLTWTQKQTSCYPSVPERPVERGLLLT